MVTGSIIAKTLSASAVVSSATPASRPDRFEVTPEAKEHAEAITKFLHEATKSLTKNKPWVRASVNDRGQITAQISGPLRKHKSDKGDVIEPLFSINIPILSAKHCGTFRSFDGFDNAWATMDFLKRLQLVSSALIEVVGKYAAAEKAAWIEKKKAEFESAAK